MRRSLLSIAAGAVISALSLFLLALTYPILFALFGQLLVVACIIVGLSILAAIPKAAESVCKAVWKSEVSKKEGAVCRYCGLALPANSAYCPRCGAPISLHRAERK